jgi:hypothetical protein
MVGDYVSTSFSDGLAFPVIAVGITPSSAAFDEAMYAPTSGLIFLSSAPMLTSRSDQPVPNAKSDHPLRSPLITYR